MTFTAKVLTVIICVLALIFATMSGVLYTKRINLEKDLKIVREDLQAKVSELQGKLQEEQGKLAKMSEDLEATKTMHTNAMAEIAKRTKDLDALQTESERIKKQLAAVTADKDDLKALLTTTDKHRQLVQKELDTKEQFLKEARESLAKARSEISNLSQKLASTEHERDNLLRDKKALTTRVDRLEARLAHLRNVFHYDTAIMRQLDPVGATFPDIRGKVVHVDPESGYVFVNKGKNDQVLKDYQFTVYRGDKFIAVIRIVDVDPSGDLSAGVIVTQTQPVEKGDSVATRLTNK